MASPRRLVKSRANRMLFGVGGGIAEYFDIDPVLVRVAFVVLTFLSGAGLIAYIILAIVMPEKDAAQVPPPMSAETPPAPGQPPSPPSTVVPGLATSDVGRRNIPIILGGLLIVIGILILLGNLGLTFWWFRWGVFWPLVLVGAGVLVLVSSARRR